MLRGGLTEQSHRGASLVVQKKFGKNIDNFFQVPLSKVVVEFYGSLSLLSADDSLKTNVICLKQNLKRVFVVSVLQ